MKMNPQQQLGSWFTDIRNKVEDALTGQINNALTPTTTPTVAQQQAAQSKTIMGMSYPEAGALGVLGYVLFKKFFK